MKTLELLEANMTINDDQFISNQTQLNEAIELGYDHLLSLDNDTRGIYLACDYKDIATILTDDVISFPINETLGLDTLFIN